MRSVSLQDLDLRRPTFRVRDMLREATLSISGHPLRSLLTMIGTLLSASVFVATLGLSSTVAQQVSSTFDVRRATEVTVKPADREGGDGQAADAGPQEWLSTVALDRLTRLAGIESAGRRVQIERVSVDRFAAPGVVAAEVPVTGVDSAALAAIDPSITQGRSFDAFHDRTASPVALVPANVARDLGISRSGTAVFLDGRAFTVIGIFDNVVSRPETLPAVVIPFAAAQHLSAGDAAAADRDVVIKTAAGAAQQIASQAALALAPGDPASLRAIAPPDPQTLRRQVEDDVQQLSLVLSAVALAIGAVSIGNAATASITMRVPELGLRRAMGARRSHVFAQLLAETTLLGVGGGIAGALLGTLTTVVVSLVNGWQPVIDIRTAFVATGACAVAGLLAGLLPALRATWIPPVAALRR